MKPRSLLALSYTLVLIATASSTKPSPKEDLELLSIPTANVTSLSTDLSVLASITVYQRLYISSRPPRPPDLHLRWDETHSSSSKVIALQHSFRLLHPLPAQHLLQASTTVEPAMPPPSSQPSLAAPRPATSRARWTSQACPHQQQSRSSKIARYQRPSHQGQALCGTSCSHLVHTTSATWLSVLPTT